MTQAEFELKSFLVLDEEFNNLNKRISKLKQDLKNTDKEDNHE